MSMINLLPEDFLTRRAQRRANILCLVLFVVVMAGVICAAMVSERNGRNTRMVRDRVNASYADAFRMISQMQQLEVEKQGMMRKANMAKSLIERVPRSTLLAMLTKALPEHASLVSVDMDTQDVKVSPSGEGAEAVVSAAITMDIKGMAATDVEVARFIANLAANPLTSSADLVFSMEKEIEIGKGEGDDKKVLVVREFQVKLQLRTDADALQFVGASSGVAEAQADAEAVEGEHS